jgi:5-methylcytosine-specific restriction endonuclease McrA
MKKRPPFNQNAAVRSAIRRVFSRSPVVREVMWKVRREVPKYNKDGTRAKKNAVQYQCNVCSQWTKSSAIAVDHILPVVDVQNGFVDWNEFVARLFCEASNLQVICDDCHQKKTNAERFARSLIKDLALIDDLEKSSDFTLIKKSLTKFTPKRLSVYPADFIDRVLKLKDLVRGTKLSKRKTLIKENLNG